MSAGVIMLGAGPVGLVTAYGLARIGIEDPVACRERLAFPVRLRSRRVPAIN